MGATSKTTVRWTVTADADRRAMGGKDRWRVNTASKHPMGEEVVPFCHESLSVQDHDDGGDEIHWSTLRMS